ncbi:hypothetical protein ACOJQI_11540 [Bacillus salacetis]|uniref:hypothetical protein n=1 Tax=Bacillus salacetis TaxID=2315464 RepID=UPI003BA18E8E
MKKIILGFVLLVFTISLFIYYRSQQPPTVDKVFKITDEWSPAIEEVYDVKKVGDDWLALFRNKHTVFAGRLKQNWLGSWRLIDDNGKEGVLATANYPPGSENEGVTWGASGVNDEVAYYFGMISNPNVNKVIIETQGKEYTDIPFIESNERRFFLIKTEGSIVPYDFKALSGNGEIIAPPFKY